jgi:muramoyltetrapeptide carboxypeptidase
MNQRLPPRLAAGDEIRVVALSRTLGGVMQWNGTTEHDIAFATGQLESLGLKVTFGRYVRECNAYLTTSPAHRLEDFHDAISSPSVKAVLAVTGGVGAIQMLDGIGYDLVAAHPKIICGYSDIANPCNAIYARTGLVTYYGPHFTTFTMRKGLAYTLNNFRQCLFESGPLQLCPANEWSDDAWFKDQENRTFLPNEGMWTIQEGEAQGTLVGGAHLCLNLLQGSPYFPPLRDAVLFLESPAEGKATLMALDSSLRSLSFQPGFSGVRAIAIGRYARSGGITRDHLTALIAANSSLKHLPVVANCDFGHITPIVTLPIGGHCQLVAKKDDASITLITH